MLDDDRSRPLGKGLLIAGGAVIYFRTLANFYLGDLAPWQRIRIVSCSQRMQHKGRHELRLLQMA